MEVSLFRSKNDLIDLKIDIHNFIDFYPKLSFTIFRLYKNFNIFVLYSWLNRALIEGQSFVILSRVSFGSLI